LTSVRNAFSFAVTVSSTTLVYLRLRVIVPVITENEVPMHPIFFVSGEKVYRYEPPEDIFSGSGLKDVARAEAVKLVLAGVQQSPKPRAQASVLQN
jgi:hypothetical protein